MAPPMRWNYVAGGLLLLLIDAYLDNVRGPVMPVLRHTLGLPYGATSWFLVAGNFGAVVCTFLMLPLSHRFGDRRLGIGICALALGAVALATQVHGFISLVLLASLLGSSIAMFGALCNLLVIRGTDVAHRARFMCGLHMMYGFGSLFAPGIAGLLLDGGHPWYLPLAVAAPALVLMAGYFYRGLPEEGSAATGAVAVPHRLTLTQGLILVVFSIYVAAEVLMSAWMVAYLVEARRLSLVESTRYLSGFFLVMGLTRALCFATLRPRMESVVLWGSLAVAGLAFTAGHLGWLWGLSLAGVMGPYFPLLLGRVSRTFPEQSRALTVWILTSVQLTLALSHLFLGSFIDRVGITTAYWLPLGLLVLSLAALAAYQRVERRVAAPALVAEVV